MACCNNKLELFVFEKKKTPAVAAVASSEKSEISTPKSMPAKSRLVESPAAAAQTKVTPAKSLEGFSASSASSGAPSLLGDEECDITKYKHFSFEFLKEDKIRDINMRPRTDPDYNPRTLYVPPEFKKTLTPALKQWWDLVYSHFPTFCSSLLDFVVRH